MNTDKTIREAQKLRAALAVNKKRLFELNQRCIDSYALTLHLWKQIADQRKALAKREPWRAAPVLMSAFGRYRT